MKKDLVIVRSKTINNQTISVIVKRIKVREGNKMMARSVTRRYVFQKYQCVMPLLHARSLIKQYKETAPHEFVIADSPTKKKSQTVKSAIKNSITANRGFVCPVCEKNDIKSKAGVASHLRNSHPQYFKEKYKSQNS